MLPSKSSTVAYGTALGVDAGGVSPDAGAPDRPLLPPVVLVGLGSVVVVVEVVVDVDVVEVDAPPGPPLTATVDLPSLANALTATTPHASTSAIEVTSAIRTCRMCCARPSTEPHAGVEVSAKLSSARRAPAAMASSAGTVSSSDGVIGNLQNSSQRSARRVQVVLDRAFAQLHRR